MQRGHHRAVGHRELPPDDCLLDRDGAFEGLRGVAGEAGQRKGVLEFDGPAAAEHRRVLRDDDAGVGGAGEGPQDCVRPRVDPLVPVDRARVQGHEAVQRYFLDDPADGLRAAFGVCGLCDLPARAVSDEPAGHGHELLLQFWSGGRGDIAVYGRADHEEPGRQSRGFPHGGPVGEPGAPAGAALGFAFGGDSLRSSLSISSRFSRIDIFSGVKTW